MNNFLVLFIFGTRFVFHDLSAPAKHFCHFRSVPNSVYFTFSIAVANIAKQTFRRQKVKYMPPNIKKNYFLVPKSSTHTGLDCVKNSATNIASLGPFKGG